jgi:hypothetical protein
LSQFEVALDLFTRNRWTTFEEVIYSVAALKVIEQNLNGHACTFEARDSVHDLRIDGNNLAQAGFAILCTHALTIRQSTKQAQGGMRTSRVGNGFLLFRRDANPLVDFALGQAPTAGDGFDGVHAGESFAQVGAERFLNRRLGHFLLCSFAD